MGVLCFVHFCRRQGFFFSFSVVVSGVTFWSILTKIAFIGMHQVSLVTPGAKPQKFKPTILRTLVWKPKTFFRCNDSIIYYFSQCKLTLLRPLIVLRIERPPKSIQSGGLIKSFKELDPEGKILKGKRMLKGILFSLLT